MEGEHIIPRRLNNEDAKHFENSAAFEKAKSLIEEIEQIIPKEIFDSYARFEDPEGVETKFRGLRIRKGKPRFARNNNENSEEFSALQEATTDYSHQSALSEPEPKLKSSRPKLAVTGEAKIKLGSLANSTVIGRDIYKKGAKYSAKAITETAKNLEVEPRNAYHGYMGSPIEALKGLLKEAYSLTDEMAKVFSLRVNSALQYATNLQSLPLPNEAPEKFVSIKVNGENPIEFIKRVWGSYLDAGVIFKDQLNEYDENLLPAIRTYCKNNKISNPDQFMPPEASVRQQHLLLLEPLDNPITEEVIIKAAERIKNKRRRSPSV